MFLCPSHIKVIKCYLHFKTRKVRKKKYCLSKRNTSSIGVIKLMASLNSCFPKPLCWNFPILCVLYRLIACFWCKNVICLVRIRFLQLLN